MKHQPLLQGINHDPAHNATLISVVADSAQGGMLWFGTPWGETRLYVAHQRVLHAENPFTEGEEAVFLLLDHQGPLNYAFYPGRSAPSETITQPLTTLFLQAYSDEPVPDLWDEFYVTLQRLIGREALPLMLSVRRDLRVRNDLRRRHAVRFLNLCLDRLPPLGHAAQDQLNEAVILLYQTYLPDTAFVPDPAVLEWESTP